MRKLGFAIAFLGLGFAVYLACADRAPPPAAAVPQRLPDVNGRYILTIGQGTTADTLTLSARVKPPTRVELEFEELGIKSLSALSPDGGCEARFQIPADPDTAAPAEVWILQGRFVAGPDSPYLDGDIRVEIEGRRNAVFRRLSSYYEGPLDH